MADEHDDPDRIHPEVLYGAIVISLVITGKLLLGLIRMIWG